MPLALQPQPSLSPLENTNQIMSDSDDFFLMNKLTNNFAADKSKLTSSATSSFDISLNEEEQFKKNCNLKNDTSRAQDVAPSSSKFDFLFKRLWFLSKHRSGSSGNCMLKTNVSSQFSNNSFVLETKRKRPPLISIDDECRRRVFVDGVGSGALNNDRFFSSQINIYQAHAPMQRTISQRFHSTRPMVNLHSRNIRMMSLTVTKIS